MFYVYSYSNPNNLDPFYIGKGSKLRIFDHLKAAMYDINNDLTVKPSNQRKHNTIVDLLRAGSCPRISIIGIYTSEDEALKKESELIRHYGRIYFEPNGILTNLCLDNSPPSLSGFRHWTRKVSIHPRIGHKHSARTKQKIGSANSKLMKGNIPWNKGKKLPPSWNAGTKGIMKPNKTSFKSGHKPWNLSATLTKFKSPSGTIYATDNLTKFAKSHNLTVGALSQMRLQHPKWKQHKGWSYDNSSSIPHIKEIFNN